MSPFATALKVGTTACILTLLEEGKFPRGLILQDAVVATREFRINLMAHGRWNWKMAKLPEHSKSNGASSRPPESTCKGETARLIGYLRVGVFVLDSFATNPTRLSAVSIGLQSDGCWRSSRKQSPFLGMIRGYSVSIWNITTSIHRVAFFFQVKAGNGLPIGTKAFGSRMPAIDHRPIRGGGSFAGCRLVP